jgi:hypothetical protein
VVVVIVAAVMIPMIWLVLHAAITGDVPDSDPAERPVRTDERSPSAPRLP